MNQKELQQKNPDKKIHSIKDTAFTVYGKIIVNDQLPQVLDMASGEITFPIEESEYRASELIFEEQSIMAWIQNYIYGGMDIQAGRCLGHNQELNGVEYHQGSETIIALSDLVLILGQRCDMKDEHYDLGKAEIFYVEKGSCVELYGTTLHYTPCQVEESGFATICILPKGTNIPIEETDCKILTKKNKFFITHPQMTAKIEQGAKPYLMGEIISINI